MWLFKYQGTEAADYYKSDGNVIPTSVKITGPRSVVNSAQTAIATVDVEGSNKTVVKDSSCKNLWWYWYWNFYDITYWNVRVTVPIYPTKYVPLEATIKGEPLEGFALISSTVKPERIKIAANQDVLNSINSIKLEELDITGANKNIMSSKEIKNDKKVTILDLTTKPVVSVVIEAVVEKALLMI